MLIVSGDGAEVIPNMLDSFTFDQIFFTGSTRVGKIIYQLAAAKLIPVTLELGGKSPCVIEADANISVATRRIAVTKFSNCGQMCIAADYILVHQSQQENLIRELANTIVNFFGEDARLSADYGKIINEKQFDRLIDFLQDGEIVFGGKTDRDTMQEIYDVRRELLALRRLIWPMRNVLHLLPLPLGHYWLVELSFYLAD